MPPTKQSLPVGPRQVGVAAENGDCLDNILGIWKTKMTSKEGFLLKKGRKRTKEVYVVLKADKLFWFPLKPAAEATLHKFIDMSQSELHYDVNILSSIANANGDCFSWEIFERKMVIVSSSTSDKEKQTESSENNEKSSQTQAIVKKHVFSTKNFNEVNEWIRYLHKTQGMRSRPKYVKQSVMIEVDLNSGEFKGLPGRWNQMLKNSGITEMEVKESPESVLKVLSFQNNYNRRISAEDCKDNDHEENGASGNDLMEISSSSSSSSSSKPLSSSPVSSSSNSPPKEPHRSIPVPLRPVPLPDMNSLPSADFQALVSLVMNEEPTNVFTNLRKIGKGSFGEVFVGTDTRNGSRVAIKKMAVTSRNLRYIISEITVQQNSQHPNIVSFLGSYLLATELWVAMEFMRYGDLASIIFALSDSKKTMPENLIAFVCLETLKALSFVHSNHRLHRDIKSDNILLGANGEVKLADFGNAIQLTQQRSRRATMCGTPFWMAPEVIHKQEYGPEVDIWSLGILLTEMAEGDPPYFDESTTKALFKISTVGVPPLKDKKKWSADMYTFHSLCLQLDPSKRPAAIELLQHPFLRQATGNKAMLAFIKSTIEAGNHDHSEDCVIL